MAHHLSQWMTCYLHYFEKQREVVETSSTPFKKDLSAWAWPYRPKSIWA